MAKPVSREVKEYRAAQALKKKLNKLSHKILDILSSPKRRKR